jgi:hypothetical protein
MATGAFLGLSSSYGGSTNANTYPIAYGGNVASQAPPSCVQSTLRLNKLGARSVTAQTFTQFNEKVVGAKAPQATPPPVYAVVQTATVIAGDPYAAQLGIQTSVNGALDNAFVNPAGGFYPMTSNSIIMLTPLASTIFINVEQYLPGINVTSATLTANQGTLSNQNPIQIQDTDTAIVAGSAAGVANSWDCNVPLSQFTLTPAGSSIVNGPHLATLMPMLACDADGVPTNIVYNANGNVNCLLMNPGV